MVGNSTLRKGCRIGLLFGLMSPGPLAAQSLLVTPGTLFLSDRSPSGEIHVGNPGEGIATFEVQETSFRQLENGRLVSEELELAEQAAHFFIRFGPRQFSLAGGEAQLVRLVVRPPGGLPPGEYRIHLSVVNLTEEAPQSVALPPPSGLEGIMIPSIRILVARATRVLYRHQVVPMGGSLGPLELEEAGEGRRLRVGVERRGETSFVGTLRFELRSESGEILEGWPPQGVSIYRELPGRSFERELGPYEPPPGARFCAILQSTDPGAPQLPPEERCLP